MKMQDEPTRTGLDRRTVALLGLAGASVMALGVGRGRGALAATPEGFSVETLQESDSIVPGIGRVRLREATWAPGTSLEAQPMGNPMVCRMVEGALDQMVDGKPMTRKAGDLWTCRAETVVADTNNGSVPAVMHIIDLLPA